MAGTVTVACKLPHGLKCQVYDAFKTQELVMGGGSREVTLHRPRVGGEFEIKGYAAPFGMQPSSQVVGGFALTHGVDKDLWDAWVAQNQGAAVLEKGLIFAHEKRDMAGGYAKEHEALRNGLEALDPDKPIKGIERYTAKAA